ncbi:MAG: 30S ribosomal protein S9, partial [Micrococcaceae bacterium]|nr:30S ribosomal protein S9 [Micrococcaceae bacterium]
MAQNTEELNETEGAAPSAYTSESSPAAEETVVKERPALTVGGSAVGRRKQAIARVRLSPGTGQWTVNGRTLEEYFPNKLHQQEVNDPFKLLELDG